MERANEVEKTELLSAIEVPKGFTDVLYLTNQGQMPSEIKRLLRQRKLSFRVLPIDKFPEVRSRLNIIGTVVIDVEDSDAMQQQKLARIIESLEMENIGVILLLSVWNCP